MVKAKTAVLLLITSIAGLSACTTVKATRLPMSTMNHCAAPVGVSVKYGTLTIALGDRPSMGYGIEIVGQDENDGKYEFIYQETKPEPGRMYAQVITQPCAQVVLPVDWKQVQVTDQQSGKIQLLTPADDSGNAIERVKKATRD